MGNIITGYLLREMLKSSAATVFVLFVILLSNALGRVLADIADGDLPRQALWPVLMSQSISMLSLVLPIGIFLGIVFAFGRMYKDHEIVVMQACGIGYRQFYKPIAIILVPLLLFSFYASLWLTPQVQGLAQSIVDSEQNLHEFQQIKPGQFNQSKNGEHIFYMESISDDRQTLNDIIISQSSEAGMVLETARSGRQKLDPDSGDLFLVVGPGERYEGEAGKNNYKIIDFEQHGILIENKNKPAESVPRSRDKTPAQLWASGDIKDRVELHWRIAIPVTLLMMALLAVPLAYIAPRKGRFGKVGYALLVFVVYMNLIALTRAQLENGTLPIALNFWWVHLLFAILTLALLYRRNRGVLFRRAPA